MARSENMLASHRPGTQSRSPEGLGCQVPFLPPTLSETVPDTQGLLYTDGVVEALAPGGEQFGKGRALRLVGRHRAEKPDAILKVLFGEVRRFTGGFKPTT